MADRDVVGARDENPGDDRTAHDGDPERGPKPPLLPDRIGGLELQRNVDRPTRQNLDGPLSGLVAVATCRDGIPARWQEGVRIDGPSVGGAQADLRIGGDDPDLEPSAESMARLLKGALHGAGDSRAKVGRFGFREHSGRGSTRRPVEDLDGQKSGAQPDVGDHVHPTVDPELDEDAR